MKRIVAVNASPRVKWNTAQLVREAAAGAQGALAQRHGQLSSGQLCPGPGDQGGEQEADQVAARDPEQRAEAALESGKNGRAHRAEQEITGDGQKSPACPEQGGDQADGKGLHGKGYRRRNRNPGTDGDERRRQGHVREIPRCQLAVQSKHLPFTNP